PVQGLRRCRQLPFLQSLAEQLGAQAQDIIQLSKARAVRWRKMTRTLHNSRSKTKSQSQPRQIERQVLPNGVRVVTERMPHVRSVSVGLWIGTGSREEQLHETGLSH